MDVAQAVRTRRSVRKYLDKKVPRDLIGAVIESGAMAPSSGNKQNWRFVIVETKNLREQIAKHCAEQYWMIEAPIFIVVCSDDEEMRRFYGERGIHIYSIQNCAAAIENMLIMANALGLGSCWVSKFDDTEIANDVGLSSGVSVQAVVTLGYPGSEIRKKELKPLKNLIYFESYGKTLESFAPFLYDWSVIISDHAEEVSEDLRKILKSELKTISKEIDAKWSKISTKISNWYKRKY